MNEIMEKLIEHDKRFDEHDRLFEEINRRLNKHDARFDHMDSQIDSLARAYLVHEERLDRIEQNMATKQDLARIMVTLDEIIGYVKKTDQEITMIVHALERFDERITRLEKKENGKIKSIFGLI